MKRDQDKSSLTLVTLATLVMGLDYALALFFPGLGAVLSLNRVLFLGIIVYDFQTHPSKYSYSTGGPIYVACYFILMACLPFLVFVEADVTGPLGAFNEFTGLIGTSAYLIFFYVNCRGAKTASRISVILFLCSAVIVGYVLFNKLGIVGEMSDAYRGGLHYTRLAGYFDPNTIMIYMISCFAFGPLLALQSKAFAGFWRGIAIIAVIWLGLFAVLQLNSRSGTIVMGVTLAVSMLFRVHLILTRKLSLRMIYTICYVAFFVSIPTFLQWKYGIFDTIISIYRLTDFETDTSFYTRLVAYRYIGEEILTGPYWPNFRGNPSGYSEFWRAAEGMFAPHCSFVDIYIKGGVLYLFVYICLYASSILRCLRGALAGRDIVKRAVCAGLLAYLIGFGPMTMTLSMENTKMSWGIIGCALGFTVHTRRSAARFKRRTTEVGDIAQCPG